MPKNVQEMPYDEALECNYSVIKKLKIFSKPLNQKFITETYKYSVYSHKRSSQNKFII